MVDLRAHYLRFCPLSVALWKNVSFVHPDCMERKETRRFFVILVGACTFFFVQDILGVDQTHGQGVMSHQAETNAHSKHRVISPQFWTSQSPASVRGGCFFVISSVPLAR